MRTRSERTGIVRLLLWLAAAGCAATGGRSAAAPVPGRYDGTIPCADCEGIRMELDLRADGVFFQRTTYLGRDDAFDAIGRWSARDDGRTVELVRPGATTRFSLEPSGALGLLDREGERIESELDYELQRRDGAPPLEPRLQLRGMFAYLADAARFRECVTGASLPVSMEAAYVELERAYLELPGEGRGILAEVEGRLAERPAREGRGKELSLVVERFDGLWPQETCGQPLADADLQNTYWRLVRLRLGDRTVTVTPGRTEPHLRLHPDHGESRMTGSGGCNTLSGSCEIENERIRFGPIAGTKMYCEEVMEQEDAFLKMLASPVGWRIRGDHLDFLDSAGEPIARFEATWLE